VEAPETALAGLALREELAERMEVERDPLEESTPTVGRCGVLVGVRVARPSVAEGAPRAAADLGASADAGRVRAAATVVLPGLSADAGRVLPGVRTWGLAAVSQGVGGSPSLSSR